MKRILALASIYPEDKEFSEFGVISKQLMTYSLVSNITVVHLVAQEDLMKNVVLEYKKANETMDIVTVYYKKQRTDTVRQKVSNTFRIMQIGRMVTQILMEENEFDQVHVHESWPLIMLGRELNIIHRLPYFLFEYDIKYMQLSYRKKNRLSFLPFLVVLFSAKGVTKIFGHSLKILKKISSNLNVGSKASIIPLAVNTELYFMSESRGKSKSIYYYLSHTKPERIKVIFDQLNTFATENPDFTINVVINPADQNKTIKLIPQGLSENIIFHRECSTKLKSQLLREAAICIILKEHNSQLLLLNEALCSGCAVLTLKKAFFTEDINDNNSVIIESNDISEMKSHLDLMKNTKFDHSAIALRAFKSFNPEKVSEIYQREIHTY